MKEVKWQAVARSLSQMLEQTPAQFAEAVAAQTVDSTLPLEVEAVAYKHCDGGWEVLCKDGSVYWRLDTSDTAWELVAPPIPVADPGYRSRPLTTEELAK